MKITSAVSAVVVVSAIVIGLSACGGGDNPPVDVHGLDVPADLLPGDVHGDVPAGDIRPEDSAVTDVAGTDLAQIDATLDDVGPADVTADVPPVTGDYTVLAWNNLGMHCYNASFKTLAVLPPFNTLWAQVIRKGGSPQVVTSGITLEYSFPGNTWSGAGTPPKSDFWMYVADVFGVTLEPDAGLTGKGLTGTMDVKDDHFEAEGIPITEFRDVDAVAGGNPMTWNRYPYQLATIIVKETATGRELTRTRVVAPVSSEMNCQTCHGDTGSATTKYPITPSGTGDVDLNILRIHDHLSGTNHEGATPVLCATCHASNALGMTGNPALPNLSNAIHSRHSNVGITADTAGCYSCHPGPKTKCLRDVMTEDGDIAGCIDCHGNLAEVATNPNPWLNEPRCDSAACHGGDVVQDKPLYTVSKGHHGVYCAGCHDSPHAIAPSRETNDGIKFMDLQGDEGPVKECNVCHSGTPDGSIHEDN